MSEDESESQNEVSRTQTSEFLSTLDGTSQVQKDRQKQLKKLCNIDRNKYREALDSLHRKLKRRHAIGQAFVVLMEVFGISDYDLAVRLCALMTKRTRIDYGRMLNVLDSLAGNREMAASLCFQCYAEPQGGQRTVNLKDLMNRLLGANPLIEFSQDLFEDYLASCRKESEILNEEKFTAIVLSEFPGLLEPFKIQVERALSRMLYVKK